ncbi:MAG: FAD:protein FMN transferase [Magnetococcales bacterium]|nr:FAD:protein FMN transferase [Magnetococcales bacterium]
MNWLLARRGRNLVSLISICVLLYAAFFTGGDSALQKKRTTTRLLMGTLISITTWGVPEKIEQQGVAEAFAEIARIEDLMSRHKTDSPVAKLNHGAGSGQPQVVPSELITLLTEAQKIQQLSQGAFNPGLGKLIVLWGFSGDENVVKPPKKAEIASWLQSFQSAGGIELSQTDSTISITNPEYGLDLGGIAKGYAIDRAILKLKKSGVVNALVNAGGDLRGIGSKGDASWRVGVQHPRDREKIVVATEWPASPKADMAMVTSGDYERFFIHNQERFHHIINPNSGYPARSGLLSVSVQADSATAADAWSTAFFVLGEDKSRDLLKKLPSVEVLLVRSDGTHWQSDEFRGKWLGKTTN